MDIEEYVARREKHLEGGAARIRNYHVFDFNYIPEEPLMREEVKPVVDAILRYEKTGIANNLLVFGSRGSGKTLMVRYLMRLFETRGRLRFAYANCRTHNTSFKILAHVLGLRPRGCSLDEFWQKFCEEYPGPVVLVLDEVDLLSDKDKNKDILYLASRSQQGYMTILLSNNPKLLGQLDESVRSTLQPEVVHFRNYTGPEIQTILEGRARLGLARAPPWLLGKIAGLTARDTNSDVRVAIKTLYYAAIEPGAGVEQHFERARRDILADVISDLNDKNLLILKAALADPERYVKSVYERYRRLSADEKEEPFSYVYFYSNLSYLQSIGLVLLVSTKVGRSYTNRIQLLFDRDALEAALRGRFS